MGTEEGGVGLPPLDDSSDLLSSSDSLSSEEDDDNSEDGGDNLNTVEEGGVDVSPLNDSSDLLSSSDSLSSEDDDSDGYQTETEEEVGPTKKTTAFGGAVILLSESSTEEDDDTDTECCEFSLPAPTGHHSSQDHTLQCWEDVLQAAIQQCNSMDAPTMSRTSSEEELATIFGDQDTPVSMPHPPPPSTPPPTQEATYQLFPEKNTDTDFIHKWWEMRNQFLLQQQQSGDHHNLTTTPWTSGERELRSGHCDTGLNKSHGFHHSAQSAFQLYHETSINHHMGHEQQQSDHHNLTTTPWTSAERELRSGHCVPTGHHSSQDHTLQCWEDMLEAAIQQCNSMDAPTMSRTSSEEELATIFGDQDTPVSMPHPPPTSTPPPTQEATYQLFPEEAVKDIDTDFIHKWWEMRNQFLLQQQQSGDHHNLTTTPWTSAERELRSGHCDTGLNKSHGFHHSAQSAFQLGHEPAINHHTGHQILTHPSSGLIGYPQNFSFPTQSPSEPAVFPTQTWNIFPQTNAATAPSFSFLPGNLCTTGSVTDHQPQTQYSSTPIITELEEETPAITQPDITQPPLSPAALATSETASRDTEPPQLTPPSSRGQRPAPLSLNLSLGVEEELPFPPSSPPPPAAPVAASGPSTAERMWAEYAANRSTSPEYFLFPPFTPEQEQWIVQVGHPFKDYVLQTWQDQIHSSVEVSLRDLVN